MRASRGRRPGQTTGRQTASQLSPDSHRKNTGHPAHSEQNKVALRETSKEQSSSDESDGPGQLEEHERAASLLPSVARTGVDLDAMPELKPEGLALTRTASEDHDLFDIDTSEEESSGAPRCSAAAASAETKPKEITSLRRRQRSKFALLEKAPTAASAMASTGIFPLPQESLKMASPESAADTALELSKLTF